MNNTKQTAVEWLINHWTQLQSKGEKMSWNQIIDITKLALTMEREQIIEARKTAPLRLTWPNDTYKQEAEQYYTDNYGNK